MTEPNKNYMGKHTTIGYLTPKEWKELPYLKENKGMLPPLVIAVGDARRATRACQVLGFEDVILLHEEGENLLGLTGRGRVDLILGTYVHKDKKIPILIVETQMGMPATEIILREIFSHCSTKYHFNGKKIKTDGLYVIRVGTAGGINNMNGSGSKVRPGDIVNATFSIGWSGALIQSMAGLDYSSKEVIEKFKMKWEELGHSFTEDSKYPLAKKSPELVEAVDLAAQEMGVTVHKGGNFSKDSLYAEIDVEAFLELRRKYDILSTEMEQMTIAQIASEFKMNKGMNIHTGLVSSVLGVLSETSFEPAQKEVLEKYEGNALKVAAMAFWHIVHD